MGTCVTPPKQIHQTESLAIARPSKIISDYKCAQTLLITRNSHHNLFKTFDDWDDPLPPNHGPLQTDQEELDDHIDEMSKLEGKWKAKTSSNDMSSAEPSTSEQEYAKRLVKRVSINY